MEIKKGIAVSPGVVVGEAFVLESEEQSIVRRFFPGEELEQELGRFDLAVARARGQIEERIDQVLAQKRELFEAILADAHSPRTCGLSQAEIFGLFDLQLPTGHLDVSSDAA